MRGAGKHMRKAEDVGCPKVVCGGKSLKKDKNELSRTPWLKVLGLTPTRRACFAFPASLVLN